MNKNDIKHLYSRVEKGLPGYRLKDNFVFAAPVKHILCGILFDSSAFSKRAFYMHAFVQPLYVPAEQLVLTFGRRLPGNWEYSDPEVHQLGAEVLKAFDKHALPLHRRLATPEHFMTEAERTFSPTNIHLQQALVFTAILLGRIDAARDHLFAIGKLVSPRVQVPDGPILLSRRPRSYSIRRRNPRK